MDGAQGSGVRTVRGQTTAFVVLDCNEWIRLKWLATPIGRAFLSELKRDGSLRLAIPEVLDQELNKHRAEVAAELLGRLENIAAEINLLADNPLAVGPFALTEVALEVAIRHQLHEVAGQVDYPAMTIDQVRRALLRVNSETPPNGHKNQQMKDSLLWEACVALADELPVFLVTADKAFYSERTPARGLAANLANEAAVVAQRLKVFPSLESAMHAFSPAASVDRKQVSTEKVSDLIADRALTAFGRSPIFNDLMPTVSLRGVVPDYFRSDIPHRFAVSFSAFYFINKGVNDVPHGQAAVSGECVLDTRAASIDLVSLANINWKLTRPEGGELNSHEVLL
ncbi:PIN domain-containing protein [Asanoa iriomotensis]|uniref:DUF4935 domain-containing protein n=1 Tax=Asanoa iriomotensis TaxID=234613 RepID=A0ABQ4CF38_9ACTN|nr:PIN domain-containing protein [Asanoa iriomotensis]GIF61379.1 hypothetical protein Air01nite_74740 [Asanoa iriomotensis]